MVALSRSKNEPPHKSEALKGAFGLENIITIARFVAGHVYLGIGLAEEKLRSNTHISDFHDMVRDNDLNNALEQELPNNILSWIIVRLFCYGLSVVSSSLID